MDKYNELYTVIARLETKIDMLEAELSYLDEKLITCGFSEGIKTLKATIEEIIVEDTKSSAKKSRERKG